MNLTFNEVFATLAELDGLGIFLSILFPILALILGVGIGSAIFILIPIIRGKSADKKAQKLIRDAEIKAEQIRKNAQLDGKQTVDGSFGYSTWRRWGCWCITSLRAEGFPLGC